MALRSLLTFARRTYGITPKTIWNLRAQIRGQFTNPSMVQVFRYLLEFGKSISKEEMLYSAILQHQTDLSLAVIKRGPDVNGGRFYSGQTYLHFVCQQGDVRIIQALVERGTEINVFDDERRTPVSICMALGFHDIAEQLISKGGDPFLQPPASATLAGIDI